MHFMILIGKFLSTVSTFIHTEPFKNKKRAKTNMVRYGYIVILKCRYKFFSLDLICNVKVKGYFNSLWRSGEFGTEKQIRSFSIFEAADRPLRLVVRLIVSDV